MARARSTGNSVRRQAGPSGVAERPVVPRKPGNAGGGKGPQLKRRRKKRRRTEGLAMSLATPPKCSEVADGVACQSEGIAQLSLLCAVRQGVSSRTCWRMPIACCQGQWRSGRSGRPDVRGHRGVRGGAVAGRTGGRTEESNVSTAAGAAGVDPQAGWQAAAVRNSDDPGSGGADGGGAGSRTDLRGRPAAGTVRLSAETAVHWTP